MKDYFDIRKEFLRNKNVDLAYELNEELKKASSRKQLCSALLSDSNKLDQFKEKASNLFHRIDSVGFALNQMKVEEKYWEKFMETVFHPDKLLIKEYRKKADWVIGTVEPITLEFAFESFLFFVDATFEYLSQTIGVVFSNQNVKKVSKLINLLQENYAKDKLARKIVKILNKGESLWAEIQEKSVREFFENVEPYTDTYEGKSLRDIVGHYRAIKISPIQMTMSREGVVTSHTLKAGAWKVRSRKTRLDEKVKFGDPSAGLVYKTEDYLRRLVYWMKLLLELIYGEKSTSF